MQPQTALTKKQLFIYVVFMAWAFFSMVFLFADLSVISFLRISLFTTPIIVLNIFAIALYICMPPKKQALGIATCMLWGAFCIWLFVSPYVKNCDGVFGSFVGLFRSFPYEVLIMIAVSIVLYLLFIPFKIVSTSIKQPFVTQSLRDYFKALALPCLAALSGAAFHGANNADFLTPLTFLMFVIAFVSVAAGAYSLLAFALRKVLHYRDIAVMAALSMLAWMYLPSVVAMLRLFNHPLWIQATFICITPIVLFYVLRNHARLLVMYTLLSLPFSAYAYFQHAPFDITAMRKVENTEHFKVPALPAALLPQDSPNVYLFVYDGTPNLQMLNTLNIEGRDDLKETLDVNKFRVYDNTYSISQVSLTSMSSTYNISPVLTSPEVVWQANGGSAAGFEVFRKNGYKVESIQQSFMTSAYQNFDVNLPPRGFLIVEKGDFLYFLIKAIFLGEFQFEDLIKASGDLTPYKKQLFAQGPNKRMVVVHNYYPGHSQLSGACLPNQKETYESKFSMARDMLREDVALIDQHDPGAIIIVMGDHGPYLTGDCTSLANSDPKSVTELEVFDRFSTLVAIRWPDAARAAKYDADLRINQDILPTVFAYLYDSPAPLQWKIEPKAFLNGKLIIDDGKFCPVK